MIEIKSTKLMKRSGAGPVVVLHTLDNSYERPKGRSTSAVSAQTDLAS